MERIKFNTYVFELITNGVMSTEEKITISFLPDNMSLSSLEEILSNEDNTKKIYLMSEYGEELRIYRDYCTLKDIGKQLNIAISQGQITGNAEESPVSGDVVTIVLGKADVVSKELAKVRADVDYIAIMADIELQEANS